MLPLQAALEQGGHVEMSLSSFAVRAMPVGPGVQQYLKGEAHAIMWKPPQQVALLLETAETAVLLQTLLGTLGCEADHGDGAP